MKPTLSVLACLPLLCACSMLPWHSRMDEEAARPMPAKPAAPTVASDGTPIVSVDGAPIERVEFRAGVSSATVERMARERGCTGGVGAGLITEPGPVEVYRMTCEDGKVFRARCELRQCTAM